MKRIKSFFAEYTVWEDYLNGMYDYSKSKEDEVLISKAATLLSNKNQFKKVCLELIQNWPIATKVNLTNISCNRRAWLGQAACNYYYKVPEILTRIAWSQLSDNQRYEANKIADSIIKQFGKQYETENNLIHSKMENYSLFE